MLTLVSALPHTYLKLVVENEVNITEREAYRPDRIQDGLYGSKIAREMFCNQVSNQSPISLEPNSTYLIPTVRILNLFLEVKGV
jgi:hypothetical protein